MQYVYRGETFIDIGENISVRENDFVKREVGQCIFLIM